MAHATIESELKQDRPTETSRTPERLPFLDGLRGFFAILVVVYHYAGNYEGIWTIFLPFGNTIGVFGFFLLSSFLLTYRLLFEQMSLKRSCTCSFVGSYLLTIVKYAIRRIARIYPMYVVSFLVGKLGPSYWWPEVTKVSFSEFFDSLCHVTTRYTDLLYWTIQVESAFYVVIPVITLGVVVLGRRMWVLSVLVLVGFSVWAELNWTSARNAGRIDYYGKERKSWLPAFLPGSALAVAYYFWIGLAAENRFRSPKTGLSKLSTKIGSSCQWAFGIAMDLLCFLIPSLFILVTSERWDITGRKIFYRRDLGNIPAFCWTIVLFFALSNKESRFSCLFTAPFWTHCGKISYSIYLLQMSCHGFVKHDLVAAKLMAGFEGLAIYLLVLIGVSTLTFFAIERPTISIGNSICSKIDTMWIEQRVARMKDSNGAATLQKTNKSATKPSRRIRGNSIGSFA